MAQQTLNDGVSFGEQRSKINSNFTELYSTKTNNSNAAIVGGTIDATSIGQTTPAAGAFTSLSATGTVYGGAFNTTVATGGSTYLSANAGTITTLYGASDPLGVGLLGTLSAHDLAVYAHNAERARFSASGLSITGRLTTAGIIEDSAGNLGLGVTPSAWASFYKGFDLSTYGGVYGASIDNAGLINNGYYNGVNWIYKNTAAATNYSQSGGTHAWFTAPSGTAGQPISFTQAMTLDASGNLLVGTTSYALSNDDNVMIGGPDGVVYVQHSNGRVSGSSYINFNYNSSIIGSITQNGTTAVAYNTTSDHRLKENIRPANAGRFNDIKFVDFEWIDGRHDCGVIAHQLQEIYPDLVIGEKDATEVRKVEITPAVPAVTEQKLVSEAIFNEDGEEIEPAVYETIEITPAVEAVFEDQEFPVYQQVNYIGLIGRIGTRIQMLDKLATEQAEVISKLEARLSAIEAKLN